MRSRLTLTAFAVFALGCPQPTPATDSGSGPIVTSISPASGPVTGGTLITLNGTGFVSGAVVRLDDVLVGPATVLSGEHATVRTPAVSLPGTVGVTLVNPDGQRGTLANGYTYTSVSQPAAITAVVLSNPAQANDGSGQATINVSVTGQVEAGATTRGAGQGGGLRGQVGYATTLSATPTDADFTWVDAAYVSDADGATAGDLARDVYTGAVSVPGASGPAPVTYSLAVRFSTDNGTSWTLGDRDGSGNGVSAAQLAKLTVTRASVDWCKLGGELVEAPPVITLRGSAPGPVVQGQVYRAMVTTVTGASTHVRGQLGYGAAGSDPSTWTWADAPWAKDTGGGSNDEHQATLPNPGPGQYKFAYRFNVDDGPWSYCDADGLANNGFTEAQAGTLTVTGQAVDRCVLQFPSTLDLREGRVGAMTYGRVFAQGITDLADAGVGVEGQVGFGPSAAAPTDSAWSWTPGAFNVKVTGGGDEYQAALTGPVPGTYAWAWRFRLAGGAWEYCDRDGSDNGFQAAQAGAMTSAAFDLEQCTVDGTNAVQSVAPSATSLPYKVAVTATTLTELAGQGAGVQVEVAQGAPGTQPSTWSTWTAASFVGDIGLSDQYQATVMSGAVPGTFDVAFRARLGSKPFVYCDRDGAANGYQAVQAARLAVTSSTITACKLEAVSSASVHSGDALTATVSVGGTGTATAGATTGLRVQVGVGTAGTNASSSSLWGWAEATYGNDAAGRDVFAATVQPAYTGTRSTSARASFDNGVTWTYCDLNGSDVMGYELTQQYDVTVTNHTDLAWCNLQYPGTLSNDAGTSTNEQWPTDGGLGSVYGQVYQPGLTPNDAGVGVSAWLGFGAEAEDPGTAWTWLAAPFFGNPGASPNNNEYRALVRLDAGTSFMFRFSRDGGSFCYGDLDGSGNGVSGGANLGRVLP